MILQSANPDTKDTVSPDNPSRKRAAGNLLAALASANSATRSGDADQAAPQQDKEDAPTTHESSEELAELGLPAGTYDNQFPLLPPLTDDPFYDNDMADLQQPQFTSVDAFPPITATEGFPLSMSNMPTEAFPSLDMAYMTNFQPDQEVPQLDPIDTTQTAPPHVPDRREIEAFAKLEFQDGNYYITTYACELGRDLYAYQAAVERAEQAKSSQGQPQSSSGKMSRHSDRVRNVGESQVQGSVVSEAGGFGAVDDAARAQKDDKAGPLGDRSIVSVLSGSDVVAPQDVLINAPLVPFDYHKTAERQAQLDPFNEEPAPVTADHMPKAKADDCPLIPIHAPSQVARSEVEANRAISRRHVRIQWDWRKDCWTLKILGRNGAFLDGEFQHRQSINILSNGSKIQISGVDVTFRLPRARTEPPSDVSDHEDGRASVRNGDSTSPTSDEVDASTTPIKHEKSKTKIVFKDMPKPATSTTPVPAPEPTIGPDGLPLPTKRRGPGRPPKDGIMSTRERKEREKAAKLLQAREANGGRTPEPAPRPKPTRASVSEAPVSEPKQEKRKYKKRKGSELEGDVLPSIEGNEESIPDEPEQRQDKKPRRASKSLSPDYPPREHWTEEQLNRPTEPYATLIYDILMELYPRALPLKQIYRELKKRYPYFVHKVDSDGWQSSVRHNLNQEYQKLFDKGEKEGKGFAWLARPEGRQQQQEKKRQAQQQSASKPKPPPAPRNQYATQAPQAPLNWQPGAQFMQQNGMPMQGPQQFFQGSNGPMPPPPNGMPWPLPPGQAPPAGTQPGSAPPQTPNQQGAMPYYPQSQANHANPAGNAGTTMVQQSPHPLPINTVQAASQSQPPTGPSPAPQQPYPTTAPASLLPPPPPPSSSSFAAPNMPCTMAGIEAINRFEMIMYEHLQLNSDQIANWRKIFASAKGRLLHGHPASSMPNGETKEELTIMRHIADFISKYRNPNFRGFRNANTQTNQIQTQPMAPSSRASPLVATGTPQQSSQVQLPALSANDSNVSPALPALAQPPTSTNPSAASPSPSAQQGFTPLAQPVASTSPMVAQSSQPQPPAVPVVVATSSTVPSPQQAVESEAPATSKEIGAAEGAATEAPATN